MNRPLRKFACACSAGLLCLGLGGCAILAVGAHAMPAPKEDAAYKNLAGQSAGIVVWADSGILDDRPHIEADVANGLQEKIQQGVGAKADGLRDVHLVPADSLLKFEDDHPELGGGSASDLAKAISREHDITRLIYVELLSVSTHPNESVDLLRGSADARIEVLERVGGVWSVAYSDRVGATYPTHSLPEGEPNLDEPTVYSKTIDQLTTELGSKFVAHEAKEDIDQN